MNMADSGYKNWCWQVKLLVNIVQAPTLFSLDISNEFSVTTAPAFIKNELIDLAERIWLKGLHGNNDWLLTQKVEVNYVTTN